MIKYLGSKRTLIPTLLEILQTFPRLSHIGDVFSGTSRVGQACKRAGYRVTANDHNTYAHCLAQCYVASDLEEVEGPAKKLISEFNQLPGSPGYFTDMFCEQARFFQPKNGARVDAIREAIHAKGLPPKLHAVVLTSLMEAADRVDSTCGLQMAYVKKWATRSFNDLEMRMPDVVARSPHGPCQALQLDALEAVGHMDVDIAYLDPPYNQHSYLSNYHIWESLVLWDKPEAYGIARKRIDCRTRKSSYNSKRSHHAAFAELIAGVQAPLIVVSFNNEGYQSRNEMEQMLACHGNVFVVTKDFKRYVGAQIGVYNPKGDRVGKVSHLRNEEYIYLVARPDFLARVPDALNRLGSLAQRIDDRAHGKGESGDTPREDRVSRLTRVLAGLGKATRSELRQATELSDYQTRMGLESLVRRGLVATEGDGRRRTYALAQAHNPPEAELGS